MAGYLLGGFERAYTHKESDHRKKILTSRGGLDVTERVPKNRI
jgi:ATP-dependent DNA ligase